MRLQDKTKIEVTGFEVEVAHGCLTYIRDYKNLGTIENEILKNLIKKLEEAINKEL